MLFPHPLYHGTSSHWVSEFPSEGILRAWQHTTTTLSLYRETQQILRAKGFELVGYELWVFEQTLDIGHWEHGALCVTPSKSKADDYARSNAEYGGELLTITATALERLSTADPEAAASLLSRFPTLRPMLAGSGRPLVVELSGIDTLGLTPIGPGGSMEQRLAELDSDKNVGKEMFDVLHQMTNFAVAVGSPFRARILQAGAGSGVAK